MAEHSGRAAEGVDGVPFIRMTYLAIVCLVPYTPITGTTRRGQGFIDIKRLPEDGLNDNLEPEPPPSIASHFTIETEPIR